MPPHSNGIAFDAHLHSPKHHDSGSSVKSILITGGAGFIGGWFLRRMLQVYGTRYRIVCFDKLDYCASTKNFTAVQHLGSFQFIQGDVCCRDEVEQVLCQYHIDAIVHFAARSHVDESFRDPLPFMTTNVLGTYTLLEAARQHGSVQRFIYVSTDEVYGESDDAVASRFPGEDCLRPTNPYAASKAAAEMLVHAYLKSFQMPLVMTRCNNVFGPYQYPEKVVPRFIDLLQNGRKMTVHGDGLNARAFLFAADAAEALDVVFHRGCVGEVYKVSSQNVLQIREVAERMVNGMGLQHGHAMEEYVELVDDRPFNDRVYLTDGSKIRALGWKERTDFDTGLQLTIDWYLQDGQRFWSG